MIFEKLLGKLFGKYYEKKMKRGMLTTITPLGKDIKKFIRSFSTYQKEGYYFDHYYPDAKYEISDVELGKVVQQLINRKIGLGLFEDVGWYFINVNLFPEILGDLKRILDQEDMEEASYPWVHLVGSYWFAEERLARIELFRELIKYNIYQKEKRVQEVFIDRTNVDMFNDLI